MVGPRLRGAGCFFFGAGGWGAGAGVVWGGGMCGCGGGGWWGVVAFFGGGAGRGLRAIYGSTLVASASARCTPLECEPPRGSKGGPKDTAPHTRAPARGAALARPGPPRRQAQRMKQNAHYQPCEGPARARSGAAQENGPKRARHPRWAGLCPAQRFFSGAVRSVFSLVCFLAGFFPPCARAFRPVDLMDTADNALAFCFFRWLCLSSWWPWPCLGRRF
jgi:hypothetical protein